MASNPGYSHSEVKTGIFLTFCLALFIAMLFIWGNLSRYWRGQQTINVVFASVTSLRPDAPVRYNGVHVGRVKNIVILHLNEPDLKRLPPLKESDIDKLPLTDKERKDFKELWKTDPLKFAGEVGKRLDKRTMIELTLEVMNENDVKRFRVDDDIRINTTLMGDTSIEIISGVGEFVSENKLVLGRSGDFFTNLARSVEQVKEILSSVSDVVGIDERESVRHALRRLDTITAQVDKIVNIAVERLPRTWDRVDYLANSAQTNFDKIGDAVEQVQPEVRQTLRAATDAVKDLQQRVGALADTARDAVTDVRTDIKPVFADLKTIAEKSRDDVPALVKNAKDLTARFQTSAAKLDKVLNTGSDMLRETYPDIRRLVLALRYGAENFEEGTNLLKRKPWLIYNPAKEDPAVANAQRAIRDLEIATKRFAELSTELEAVKRNLAKTPGEKLERINFIIQELNVLGDTLKYAGDATRRDVLPAFERKKGAFIPVAEEPDPLLTKKKPDADLR